MSETYDWFVEFSDSDGRRVSATVEADSYIKAVSVAREKAGGYGMVPCQIRRTGVSVRYMRVEHDARAH